MKQGDLETVPPNPDPTAAKRALKAFIWAVVALVLFNVVLFAKFVIGAKSGDSRKTSPAAEQTNAQPKQP